MILVLTLKYLVQTLASQKSIMNIVFAIMIIVEAFKEIPPQLKLHCPKFCFVILLSNCFGTPVCIFLSLLP